MAILKRSIAHWWYELDVNPAIGAIVADKERLRDLVNRLLICANILRESGVSNLSEIILSSRWLRDVGGLVEGFDAPEQSIDIGEKTLEEVIAAVMAIIDLHQQDFCWPAKIQLNGLEEDAATGVGQSIRHPILEMEYGIVQVMSVHLYSDKWLPFSLDGKRPNREYVVNSEKLEHGLTGIEKYLSAPPLSEDHSAFCEISGYRLENLRDSDGEIIGVDEFGRFI